MSFRGSFRGGAAGGAARGGFDGKMSVMTQVRKEKEVETARLHAKVLFFLFVLLFKRKEERERD